MNRSGQRKRRGNVDGVERMPSAAGWRCKFQSAVEETQREEYATSGFGADFHALIGDIIRAARHSSRAARNYAKALARGFDLVCVTVAPGLSHAQFAAGGKFIERSDRTVFSLVSALGLRDGQQIVFHADNINGFYWRRRAACLGLRDVAPVNKQANQGFHRYFA